MNLTVDFHQLPYVEQFQHYINHMHPVIIKDALFADGTPFYRSYSKTGNGYVAHLRFRTFKNNAEHVQVVMDDCVEDMQLEFSDDWFDYYTCMIDCSKGCKNYCFRISSGTMVVYYHKRGASDEMKSNYNFCLAPDLKTPDWAKGAVFYQIFVDRFCNGDPSNDVVDNEYVYIKALTQGVKDWNSLPKAMDVGRFYGGDLQGVWDKLDYLQELGVDVIYLNPIFVSPSNHKYDIQDYDYVDPHFGVIVDDGGEALANTESKNSSATRFIRRVTNKANLEASNAFFIQLVKEIHRRGMKVILDGVFNHCGSFNKWMDRECIYEHQQGYEKGAFVDENSPYHTFFKFKEGGRWPYNENYDGWWNHNTLPKLNYESSEALENYILDIAKKWVSPPFNVDGWRLDVAADLGQTTDYNHSFWRKFRKVVKEANPEAIILAEHYGNPSPWLQGDQWDTVMNYDAFMEPLTWFLTGMEKHSDAYSEKIHGDGETFWNAMNYHMSRMHHESLQVAMNELSNHDHSRFLTRTNSKIGRVASVGSEAASVGIKKWLMRLAVMVQMTWPGAPTIYYGDEAGVCGWTDPDSRRTYPWGREDQELLQFHKEMIRLHKAYPVLKDGSLKALAGEDHVIAYGRFNTTSQMVVVINNDSVAERKVTLPVWQIGAKETSVFETLMCSGVQGYENRGNSYTVENGEITICLPAGTGLVLYGDN